MEKATATVIVYSPNPDFEPVSIEINRTLAPKGVKSDFHPTGKHILVHIDDLEITDCSCSGYNYYIIAYKNYVPKVLGLCSKIPKKLRNKIINIGDL